MTQEERNVQIALMLGWKQNSKRTTFTILKYDATYIYEHNELKFDSDWNWLMEAIQFLQKHFESKERYWTTIERYPIYSNIEDVFKVVSDFAKHYNNKEI